MTQGQGRQFFIPATMMTQSFPQAKPAQHLATLEESDFGITVTSKGGGCVIEKQRLKLHGIYWLKWTEEGLIQNPKLKSILRARLHVPPDRTEHVIATFLNWASSATNERDVYKALEVAILKGWEQ